MFIGYASQSKTISLKNNVYMPKLIICLFFLLPLLGHADEMVDGQLPEAFEIEELLRGEQPEGLVFLVMEYDIEALQWVLPRIVHYTKRLRESWPGFEIVVLSHGDEMFALQAEFIKAYPEIHEQIKMLLSEYDIRFQVCGSYAHMSGIAAEDFPSYIEVVPFAPAEIENYRMIGYKMLSLEHTW